MLSEPRLIFHILVDVILYKSCPSSNSSSVFELIIPLTANRHVSADSFDLKAPFISVLKFSCMCHDQRIAAELGKVLSKAVIKA